MIIRSNDTVISDCRNGGVRLIGYDDGSNDGTRHDGGDGDHVCSGDDDNFVGGGDVGDSGDRKGVGLLLSSSLSFVSK